MAKGMKTMAIKALAAILFAAICGLVAWNFFVALPALASNMIANDRIRAVEDEKLRNGMCEIDERLRVEIYSLRDAMSGELKPIIKSLSRIEGRLGIESE